MATPHDLDVLVLGPENPRGIVLFGSGSGGDPARYRTVLTALADAGYRVLAPRHTRFAPDTATPDEFVERPRGLKDALARYDESGDLPVFAVGHSIGGWAALCLAGAVPRESDPITPPATIEILRRSRGQVDAQVLPRVGHFDFMDTLPPGVEPDPALDRAAFLRDLGESTVAALSH